MSVTVTKAQSYVVLGVGSDDSLAVTKLNAAIVLGYPPLAATVTKVAAYVVLKTRPEPVGGRTRRPQMVQC